METNSRSFRRIQDEATSGSPWGANTEAVDAAKTGVTEEICEGCGMPVDECRDAQSQAFASSPIFGALFGALPSPEQVEQMRREATRDALLGMLAQAQNAISNGMEAAKIIVEIVDDELAGL